jgi:hypothetical protein
MNLCLGFSFKFGFNREREREYERGEKVGMKGESMNCVIMIVFHALICTKILLYF